MTPEQYWNEFYQKKPFASGKAPSDFVVSMAHRLSKGKVLDIGMGEGVNSVYLAQKGFAVKGFDISTTAVEHAAKLARETGVVIEAKKGDCDLFPLGLLEFDSILMTNFKPSVVRYYSEIIRALKQGGTLIVESPTIEAMTELIGANEAYRNFYFHMNELLHNLKGLNILFYQETEIDGQPKVQCLAKKPMDKDAARLGLFDMTTKEKNSESVHTKLADQLFKKN